MGFKENLKNRRIELDLTLEDVSKKLSVSKPTLQRYGSCVISNVPFEKVEKLAEILDTTPSWLMDWESDLLKKYNVLDAFGKHTVNTILEIEFNRCK